MKKLACLVLAVVLMAALLTTGVAEEKTYTVGICQLVQHVALDAASQGFMDELTELTGGKVEFLYQNASGDSATCATIANTFVSKNVDLIMANATAALQAASAATGDIPILGTSITDYATALDIDTWTGVTGYNISGTCDLAPIAEQAAMLVELFPDARNVGMLYCSAEPNSVYQIQLMEAALAELNPEIVCTEYTFSDSSDVFAVATTACQGSDVLYIPTDNTAASCTNSIRNAVDDNNTPIIAGEEGICSGCGVATLSISYYDLGVATGKMAYEILVNGADVSTMAVSYAEAVTKKYNAELCEQLGITIPEGYEAIG